MDVYNSSINAKAREELQLFFASKKKYPVIVSGPVGAGKTLLVRVACYEAGLATVTHNLDDYSDKDDFLQAMSAYKHTPRDVMRREYAIILRHMDFLTRDTYDALTVVFRSIMVPIVMICEDAYGRFTKMLTQAYRHVRLFPLRDNDVALHLLALHAAVPQQTAKSRKPARMLNANAVSAIARSAMGCVSRCYPLFLMAYREGQFVCTDPPQARRIATPFKLADELFDDTVALGDKWRLAETSDFRELVPALVQMNSVVVEDSIEDDELGGLQRLGDVFEELSLSNTLADAPDDIGLRLATGATIQQRDILQLVSFTGHLQFPKQLANEAVATSSRVHVEEMHAAMRDSKSGFRYSTQARHMDLLQMLTSTELAAALGNDSEGTDYRRVGHIRRVLDSLGITALVNSTTKAGLIEKISRRYYGFAACAATFNKNMQWVKDTMVMLEYMRPFPRALENYKHPAQPAMTAEMAKTYFDPSNMVYTPPIRNAASAEKKRVVVNPFEEKKIKKTKI